MRSPPLGDSPTAAHRRKRPLIHVASGWVHTGCHSQISRDRRLRRQSETAMTRYVSLRLRALPKGSAALAPRRSYSRYMRMWAAVAGIAVAIVAAGGCASHQQAQFQETIRKAAKTPVVEAEGDVPTVFRDLAQSGGLDPRTVYVALRKSDALNAAAAGNH